MHVGTYVCTCVRIYARIYPCMYLQVYVYMYTYIPMYVRMYYLPLFHVHAFRVVSLCPFLLAMLDTSANLPLAELSTVCSRNAACGAVTTHSGQYSCE
jgi:hypothetical protein